MQYMHRFWNFTTTRRTREKGSVERVAAATLRERDTEADRGKTQVKLVKISSFVTMVLMSRSCFDL